MVKSEKISLKGNAESNDDLVEIIGYIQNKDATSIWVALEPNDQKNGVVFDITTIDENKFSSFVIEKPGPHIGSGFTMDLNYD